MYLLEPVLSDNDFFQKFQLRISVSSKTWQLPSGSTCAPGWGQPGGSPGVGGNHRSGGFYRSDTEGKTDPTIPPYRTRGLFAWTVDTTTRSCMTVRKSTRAIHVLLNTIFTAIARAICMRPGNSREVKPKSYSRSRDLSRHIILGTTSPGDVIMKNSYGVCRNKPPSHPVQKKQKVGRVEEQMQRTTKEKQKLCGGGNIRW
jgi:hypothetical protein